MISKKVTKARSNPTRDARNCIDLNSESSTIAWLRLLRERRCTASQKRTLLARYHSPEAIYSDPQTLQEISSNSSDVTGSNSQRRNQSWKQEVEQDLDWLVSDHHHFVSIADPRYPELLKQISDPPLGLFANGCLETLAEPKIAMVGSRRPSPVGSKLATDMAEQLATLGIVITSGMALGIDACSHQGALAASAPTIAVLGGGIDVIYPARHRHLYEKIAREGCLLTEYPIGFTPTRYSFPQRNRIVSGLSLGVIIVEAAKRSGTLITARLAMEQNRSVMVVPGSALNKQYQGSHKLIQDGATLVTTFEDVLFELSLPLERTLQQSSLVAQESDEEALSPQANNPILAVLNDQPSSVDTIISASGLTASEVSSMLPLLEIEGLIAMTDNGGYVRLS